MIANWKPFIATRRTEADVKAIRKSKIAWKATIGHADKDAAMAIAIDTAKQMGGLDKLIPGVYQVTANKYFYIDDRTMETTEADHLDLRK
jgi:hypothetical protein